MTTITPPTSSRGLTRRGFLGVLSALAVGTITGCSTAGAAAGAGELDLGGGTGLGLGTGRGRGVTATDRTAYAPVPPFSLTSVCELSEDYFLVQNHVIDPENDKVFAYTRSNGQVEAIVLQDGVVKQVYRDPTQPGGWAVYALPDAEGVRDVVAAATQTTVGTATPYLRVCYVKEGHQDQLVVATQPTTPIAASGPSFTITTVPWNAKALSLHVGIASTDFLFAREDVLVWAMVPSSEDGAGDAQACYHFAGGSHGSPSAASGSVHGFDYKPDNDGQPCLTIANAGYLSAAAPSFVLYLPHGDDGLQVWGGSTSTTAGPMKPLEQIKPATLAPRPPRSDLVVTTVEWAVQQLRNELPTALVWTQKRSYDGGVAGSPQLWLVTFDDDDDTKQWVWTDLGLPADLPHDYEIPVATGITPQTGGGYLLDVFVAVGGTLSVTRQTAASVTSPTFTPMITLQGDVRTMTSQAGATDGNQLIVVAGDCTLHTLEKDPNGGWSDHPIQLPADELQQNSSYRVTLTLADTAWNAPVAGHDLSITASTPAVAIIEGPSPQTVQLGTTPVTVTTDATGAVMLALLADGLSASTLTVRSAGLPQPVQVYPSASVNTYMQGGSTLNELPAMSAGTLADATVDGKKVAPGATDDPADAATQVTNMQQAATWGAQGSKNGTLSSTHRRVDGGRMHGTRGHRRHDAKVSAKALGSDLGNWTHDVLHAIKKGVTTVKDLTKDVDSKIFTFVVDAAGWLNNEVKIVVHTIEDAAHVLHAAFNKLKADIAAAVKWLEALVGSLLADSAKVASEFVTLFGQTLDFVGGNVDNLKSATDHWLGTERANVRAVFDKTAAGYPANATVSTMGDFTPGSLSRRRRTPRPLRDDDDLTPQPHGDWFLNKVKHAIAGELNVPDLSGRSYSEIAEDLRTRSQSTGAKFQDDCELFVANFLIKNVLHPGDGDKLSVKNLLAEIGKLIDSAFDFVQSVLDQLFEAVAALSTALKDIMATPIGKAGIVGKLLSLAGLGRYEIGSVAAMIFAFPTTLTYKLVNGPSSRPFDYLPNGLRTRTGASPEADRALQQTAASVMGVWALLDVVGAGLEANDAAIPLLTPAVDTLAPIVLGAIAPPFTTDGLPDWRALQSSTDVPAFASWLFAILPAYIDGMGIYNEHNRAVGPRTDAATKEADANDVVDLCAKTAFGVVSMVMGIVAASSDTDAQGTDFAIPVLNNLPTVMSFCNIHAIEEATDAISVVVGSVVGFAGGETGAIMYGA